MKGKVFIGFSLFCFLISVILTANAHSAALNFTPTITLTAMSTTTIRIQIAGCRATGIDTIKVYSAGADSATGEKYWFKASTTKDTTVTSLVPYTTKIWKVRADSAGTYKTSVPDTAQTYPPQILTPPSSTIKDDWREMQKATSWPTTSTYSSTLSIIDATGSDSTMVYDVWPYTGVHIVASGDSAVIKFRFWGGNSTNSKATYHPTASSVVWNYAVVDSLSISAKGTYVYTVSFPVGCRYFYVEALGQTGNGHASSAILSTRRYRY